jgi:histidinol-phosphatase (PHP family)
MGPVYPIPWILERARAIGVPVTLGDDSHGPADVGVGLDACIRAIAAAGYREVHYLTKET